MLTFALLLLAAICFACATLSVNARLNLTALGLFLYVLVPLLAAVPR
jgi:hypothetical protein